MSDERPLYAMDDFLLGRVGARQMTGPLTLALPCAHRKSTDDVSLGNP